MSLNSTSNSPLFTNAVKAAVAASTGPNGFPLIVATTIDCVGLNTNDVSATGEVQADLFANPATASSAVGFTFNNNVQSISTIPASSFGGMQIGWDITGQGETDLVNLSQANVFGGGFNFYNASSTTTGDLLCSLQKGSVNGGLTLTNDAPNLTVPGKINEIIFNLGDTGGIHMSPMNDGAGDAPLAFNTTTNEVTINVSTIRVKQDVVNLSNTESVYNLRPVQYKEIRTGKTQVSLIAEEAYQAHPMFTWRDTEGFIGGINDKAILVSLVAELKALRYRVDQLDPARSLPVMSPPLQLVTSACEIPAGINPDTGCARPFPYKI